MNRVKLADLEALEEALLAKDFFVINGDMCCGACAVRDCIRYAKRGQRVAYWTDSEMDAAFGDVLNCGPIFMPSEDGSCLVPIRIEVDDEGEDYPVELSPEEAHAGELAFTDILAAAEMQAPLHIYFGINDVTTDESVDLTAAQEICNTIRDLGLRYAWSGAMRSVISLLPIK